MKYATIMVRTTVIGFHRWEHAPAEVAYLRADHRHEFRIRVEAIVRNDDRELEFHMLKRQVQTVLRDLYGNEHGECEFGPMSCESIARTLLSHITTLSAVEVWEEDEAGARVERV